MIDPLQGKLAALYDAADPQDQDLIEIVSTLTQRVIELERSRNEIHKMAEGYITAGPKPDVATAIRRAAELSVDHILAWHGQGTSSNMAKSMQEEIERNMLKALNL